MSYIEGFVVPVPAGNKQAYLDMAARVATSFRAHGAIRVVEAWGEAVPEGKLTDFRRAVQAEPGEEIVFSWVEWPSKEAREAGMKAAMEDSSIDPADMPFDTKRMIFGGFETILDQR